MKTKIIYISGNELFEMTAIRAAMDEVRATLGLDKDTILFGVPVDCDTAIAEQKTAPVDVDIAPAEPLCVSESEIVQPVAEPQHITPEIITPVISVVTPEPAGEPEPVPSQVEEDVVAPIAPVVDEPVIVDAAEPVVESDTDVVIPILSVLSVQEETDAIPQSAADIVAEPIAEPVMIDVVEPIAEPVAEPVVAMADIAEPVAAEPAVDTVSEPVVAEPVSIHDIITDEAPTAPMEKSLEHLFDSLTPLREDVETIDADDSDLQSVLPDDDDATLAQLASEFVASADKIKSTPQGKISKLKIKNIIPFKPKREEPSLMGDLFGWAGMAANDDDFAIPGFFKKQG